MITAAFIGLSALTVAQESIWKDSVTLWSHEIEAYPNDRFSNLLAHANRGIMYLNSGDYEKAIEDYSAVIVLSPSFADAYVKRAFAYSGSGHYRLALNDLNRAIILEPRNAEARRNRRLVFNALGYPGDAQTDLDTPMGDKPLTQNQERLLSC